MFYRTITRATANALYLNKANMATETITLDFVGLTFEQAEKVTRKAFDNKEAETGNRFVILSDWNETQEKRFMDEATFLSNAVKLEKANPNMVTRTIKADVLTAFLCHRFNDDFETAFTTKQIVLDTGLKGKPREKAIASQIPTAYVVRRCVKTGEVADLYGMPVDEFISLSKPE